MEKQKDWDPGERDIEEALRIHQNQKLTQDRKNQRIAELYAGRPIEITGTVDDVFSNSVRLLTVNSNRRCNLQFVAQWKERTRVYGKGKKITVNCRFDSFWLAPDLDNCIVVTEW